MSDDFKQRQEAAKAAINKLDHDTLFQEPQREAFFEAVYQQAEGDAAMVPWADLEAKSHLVEWLAETRPHSGTAIDVGCGLGDNAEAMASAGYETTAFDFSPDAINWARQRFPNSEVRYEVASLFELPQNWKGKFDLVHECYTLQSIPPITLTETIPAIVSLLAPGGTLLVYTRVRDDGTEVDGPPWPLEQSATSSFKKYGLERIKREPFSLSKGERNIPHEFTIWRKS